MAEEACQKNEEELFKQKVDLDFFDTFSLVTRITSIRLLIAIAIATTFDLKIHQNGRSRNDLSGLALSNDNPNGVAMRISVREALG